MNFLKINQILVIHDEVIEETGGSPGSGINIHLLRWHVGRCNDRFISDDYTDCRAFNHIS